jgi:hypothetical protein
MAAVARCRTVQHEKRARETTRRGAFVGDARTAPDRDRSIVRGRRQPGKAAPITLADLAFDRLWLGTFVMYHPDRTRLLATPLP